jgi:hypothetical protein
MYILTNRLVDLGRPALPLPWHHRAPLGLMSGTRVHVALQTPVRRPFGDLIVSIVNPSRWQLVSQVTAWRADAPGLVADVYQLVPPLNIVFAEAVTIDSGSRHDARLVVEPFDARPDEDDIPSMVDGELDRITHSLSNMGFVDPQSDALHPARPELAWMGIGYVSLGWVHAKGWRDAVTAQALTSDQADQYDVNMAVVSADTDRRILRYVFPRKGAVTIRVEHADKPGAMAVIASALTGKDLNILSSLLRRETAKADNAELVAVVEPTDLVTNACDVATRIDAALAQLPRWLRIHSELLDPVEPEDAVVYPRDPREVVVRPSKGMEQAVLAVRSQFPVNKRPIFVSRRFVDPEDEFTRDVIEELRRVLDEHGFVAVEATAPHGSGLATSDEVNAKVWASEAAIVLVAPMRESRDVSENLAHVLGFMQGLGKRLLPLFQEDVPKSIMQNAGLQGLSLGVFGKAGTTNQGKYNSIGVTVSTWLLTL